MFAYGLANIGKHATNTLGHSELGNFPVNLLIKAPSIIYQ